MKSIVLIFFLLSCALPLRAEETDPESDPDVQSQQRPPGGDSGAPTVPWPRPFTPSQEIGADSQISFPTDI
jgi:hypothetical protein